MAPTTPNDKGHEDTTASDKSASAGGRDSGVLAEALEKLREPFNAWVSAGASLGPLVGELGDKLRADLRHVDKREDADSAREAVGERVEETADEAKKAAENLGSARSAEEAKSAVAGFAATAENTLRDLSDSVRNAAGQARDTEAAEQARTAFQEAVESTRRTFDEAVEALRERSSRGSRDTDAAENASTVDELRSAVDDLVARAGEVVRDLKNTGGERLDDLRTRVQDSGSEKQEAADIIDGEVVHEGDETEPGK
ncbi:CGLAU_01105 family protein [Corynebacterium sp. CCM 9203]|uniref:CGLAU_01105 family protein n=1 Tax=Corynebacterium sp. CCM 9203 TaxID=3057615 RepID=UPI0035242665